jgi:pyridoxamine 5'-phosphate oxidase
MNDWFTTLPGLYRQMWHILAQGVADRHAAARHPTLATITPDGWPSARTVVLRAADPVAGTIDIHTDLRSDKIDDLRRCPRAGMHVWDDKLRLQIRLRCDVAILAGAEVGDIWRRVPDPSRQSYGVTPPPGTAIPNALAYEKTPDPESFAVLRLHLAQADLLHLDELHRRGRFSRDNGWQGDWLAP